jgi:predicted membrane channel-forming protein YqfA (hemolysin III family)
MRDYQQEWKRYRRLRTQFVLAWLGLFPVVAALLTVSSKKHIPQLGHAVIIVWIVAFFLTGFRVYLWRCPRCGKQFGPTVGGIFFNVQQCAQCGLPRNSN